MNNAAESDTPWMKEYPVHGADILCLTLPNSGPKV
jgi:hypothetical protein